jgi:uncharacterized delta-60 repeat protein
MPTTTLIKIFFRTHFSILSTVLILLLLTQMPRVKAAGEIDPTFSAGVLRQPRGSATTVVTQPDGKVLIGGSFEVVSGALRYSLARLNTDGSADATFNPPPLTDNSGSTVPGIVEAIALQTDGKIIVAGSFRIPGLSLEAPIVRLNADGSLDASFFASGASGVIKDVEIRADGKIFIAGSFNYTTPPSVRRANLARLNVDGSTDQTFNPSGVSLPIDDIAVQPDGKVIGFVTPDGGGGRFLRRLNEDGSLDTSFNTWVSSYVFSIKIQPDGKILIGGWFGAVNNALRDKIARLNTDGTLDQTFNSPSHWYQNQVLYEIEIESDGRILVGGTHYVGSAGPGGGLLVRLNADGTVARDFESRPLNNGVYLQVSDLALLANGEFLLVGNMSQPEFIVQPFAGPSGAAANRINANGDYDSTFQTPIGIRGTVVEIAPLANGQIVIAGRFGAVNTTVRRASIARLNADGSTDTIFNPTFNNDSSEAVFALAPLADNRVFAGGLFYGGPLELLNPDGSGDPTFTPQLLSPSIIYDVAVQPDGKVIVVGGVSQDNSTCCLMRFNPDGSLDSSFRFPVGITVVRKVLVQPDGKILIGGASSGGNFARCSVARLNADGSLDTSFTPVATNNTVYHLVHEMVFDIALETDGKILISGEFSKVNGVSRQGIARLNANGSLDTSFNAAANSSVSAVELQADGKILVGGAFTSIGGAARNRIARLNPNGSIDSTFNVGAGADGNVNSIELDASGRVLVGGEFVRYDNTPRVGIVRLLNDTAAP